MHPEFMLAIKQVGESNSALREAVQRRVSDLQDRVEELEAKGMAPGRTGPGTETKSLGGMAAEAILADLPSLEKHRTLRVELKAAGDPVTTGSARAVIFGGIGVPQGQVLGIQYALPQRTVDGATIVEYSRYTGVEGAAAQQTTEGSAKAAFTPTFSIISQASMTFAGYSKVSRQAMQDRNELARVVNTALSRSLNTVIDVGLVNGATGFAGGLEGLATAYTSLVYTGMADAISEGVATMQTAGFSPDVVALNPADWLALSVAKGTANDHYLSGNYLGALPQQLRGLRVALSPSVDAGKALLMDTAHIEVVVIGGTALEVAYAGDDFTKNLATMLIETRIAPVFRAVGAARLITPKA